MMDPQVLEFLKKKNPELFMTPGVPPISPSNFDVGTSNSTATARGGLPTGGDAPYKLTLDDITRPSLTDQTLSKTPPPMPELPDVTKPPTMPGVDLGGTPGSNGGGTRKAPPPPPQIPGSQASPTPPIAPAPTGPTDREKLSGELDKKEKFRTILASILGGLADATTARGGGKSDFTKTAVSTAAATKEKGLAEFDEAGKKKKESANDAELGNPNSAVSRSYQDAVLKLNPKMNEQTVRLLPASRLKDLLDTGEVVYKVDESRKVHEDAARESRLKREDAAGAKKSDENTKRLTKLSEALDPSKQRQGAFGVSKQVFDRAERLETLANAIPDGNLDRRQIEELAIGLNAMLSGSNTGAQEQVKSLVPQSIWGNTAKLTEFLANNPTGTQQQEFVKRMLGSVAREKETARRQINRTQFGRVASYSDLEKTDPEGFADVLRSQGVDPDEYKAWKKGGFQGKDAVLHEGDLHGGGANSAEDAAAIKWAKDNPGDPRSEEILKLHGQ